MVQKLVVTRSEVSTLLRLPPPLRGRVGERGKPRALTDEILRVRAIQLGSANGASVILTSRHRAEQVAPLSLTLPCKGGGNPSAAASLTSETDGAEVLMVQKVVVTRREVSTPPRLPPPLRGRVGERGRPRALTDVVLRRGACRTLR
ncbi:hypothetical protein CI41S_09880 [Bradyrhizobium ivorense]|nr:hypothetical protein CI41S_09880 [Bradyrhizobium ivorense]